MRAVPEPTQVRAAGGVVVSDGRVAVIHRPKYDDWSLPKGKLDAGESWEEAALREVREETGVPCRLLGELPSVAYTDNRGRPKTVRYWRMEPAGDAGEIDGSEVDELRWVAPADALALLTRPHDRDLVTAALHLHD